MLVEAARVPIEAAARELIEAARVPIAEERVAGVAPLMRLEGLRTTPLFSPIDRAVGPAGLMLLILLLLPCLVPKAVRLLL